MNPPIFSRIFLAVSSFLAVAHVVYAESWPAWRGPEGTGVCRETNLPIRWSRTENVRWRTPLSEPGNSTPIVWGDRVFITQASPMRGERLVLCFSRRDGKLLWQKGVENAENESTHDTNPLGSASAVTDGERVVAWFGSAGIHCFDLEGKPLWQRDLGKQEHIWGYGSSPILHGDLCILNFGPGERTALIAFDKKTGATVWKVEEPGGKFGRTSAEWLGSWSTPIVVSANGRDELIVPWPKRVAALAPLTGRELWTCSGLNPLVYTSPLHARGIIVVMGGFGGSALAVKSGGSGDVTATHRVWHHPKTKQRIGSGVIAGDHIYILDDPGIAECIELETGKVVWEERLQGPGKTSQSWASMVSADKKLFVINHAGDAFVLKASPQFQTISTNSIGERTLASMAMSDGEIFIRSHQALWCVSERK